MAFATSAAFSSLTSLLTRARANLKLVPGPLLVTRLPSSSTSASSLDHFAHVVRQLSAAASLRDLAQFVVKSQDMLSR